MNYKTELLLGHYYQSITFPVVFGLFFSYFHAVILNLASMSQSRTKMHKFNFFYLLVKSYQLLVFHLFYKRVETFGRKNIPYGSPIIFTPNHQNALMDALIVLNTSGLNPVFMARADIFKKKTVKKILTFFKMLPIYRMRDGAEELSKNDYTFNTCLEILSDSSSVCLMPEGNHGHHRRLRPLVKGTFRIAFRAQEEFGHLNGVKIVPVGIDFEHYQNIRQDLLVIYGNPIDVSEYMEAYTENQPKAINSIKEKLAEEMKKIIIHIENQEHYQMFEDLRLIYNKRMRNRAGITGNSLYKRFLADKQMIKILDDTFISDPEEMTRLSAVVSEYMQGLKKMNFRNWVIERKGYSFFRIVFQSILLILLSPLFLAGFVGNYLPYSIPQKLVKKVKDPQFVSSFTFVIALILFPVYYAIISLLAGILPGPAWVAWAVTPGLVLSGYFAVHYSFMYKKLRAAIRYKILMAKKDPVLKRIVMLHEEIIKQMNQTTERYMESIVKSGKKAEHEK